MVTTNHKRVGVIQEEHHTASRFDNRSQCGEKALMVIDVVEDEKAGNQVKMLLVSRQWLPEISHLIGDLALRVFRTRHLDQVCRTIDSGDPCSTLSENTRQ